MQGVCAGSKLVGGHALAQAILRGELRGEHLNFTNHFKRRIDVALQALRFRLDCHHPVEHDFVLEIHTTVDAMAEFAALHTRREKKIVVNLTVASANIAGTTANQCGNI